MDGIMRKSDALNAISALADSTRLDVFKLLVRAGSGGLPANAIAVELHLPQSGLSAHLNTLIHAGLIRRHRDGVLVRYYASPEHVRGLVRFVFENVDTVAGAFSPKLPDSIAC